MATLTSIWKQCNSLRWYSEKEYYVTHATYIRGLLRNGRLAEGLAEYAFYNRYNGVNNTVNTVVLEGLTEGGFYRECIDYGRGRIAEMDRNLKLLQRGEQLA